MPRSQLPPSPRDGQPHHGRMLEHAATACTTRRHRACRPSPNLHCAPRTICRPNSNCQEENHVQKLGPESLSTLQAIQHPWYRRPTRDMSDLAPPHKGKHTTKLRDFLQRERKSALMQTPPSYPRSGSPPPRTPLLHRGP